MRLTVIMWLLILSYAVILFGGVIVYPAIWISSFQIFELFFFVIPMSGLFVSILNAILHIISVAKKEETIGYGLVGGISAIIHGSGYLFALYVSRFAS